MSANIIEVKFKGQRRALFENPLHFPFRVNDYVVVEAEKGIDVGRVNRINQVSGAGTQKGGKNRLRKVIRRCSEADWRQFQQNMQEEKKAYQICKEKIAQNGVKMKLVDCEFQFDKKKITFRFTAEKRVDFRKLVKEMAAIYKTRIEFRQIGARDEARRLGGYGACGLRLCCSAWITDFKPITTQAAKDQNLSLNPSKLAGVCGRLKCCLMYERDFYNEAIKKFPQLAKPIQTERGEGIVSNIDIFNETVLVLYPDDTTETYSLDYLQEHVYKCQQNCGHPQGNLEEVSTS